MPHLRTQKHLLFWKLIQYLCSFTTVEKLLMQNYSRAVLAITTLVPNSSQDCCGSDVIILLSQRFLGNCVFSLAAAKIYLPVVHLIPG